MVEAGWIKDMYAQSITKAPLPIFRRVSTRGVEVGYPNGNADGLKIAESLASGLVAANIDCTTVPFTDLSKGIVVNVGLR